MSIQLPIPQIMLDTVLDHFVLLFGGDPAAARQLAQRAIAEYDPRTMEELSLVAAIVSFQRHVVKALAEATEPGLSPAKAARLRGSAVSMSREGHKAQRKLDQLQKSRTVAAPAPPARKPQAPKAPPTWTQDDHRRYMAQKIAENSRNNAASHSPSNPANFDVASAYASAARNRAIQAPTASG